MTTRLRTALGPLVLVLASLLCAVVIGEIVVRVAFPPAPATLGERLLASGAYEGHPVLGWRPRPNARQHSQRFNATFTTNSRGLRDRERTLERTPGIQRIVLVGDSFAWGYGVNDGEVFPRLVESRLERTEVVNLGVSAFGLRQEFDYLKLEGALYQPDIVILTLCQNDIYRDGRTPHETYRAVTAPAPSRKAPPTFWGSPKAWVAERVVLYRVTQQAIATNRSLVKALVALGLKDGLVGFEGLDNNLMPALMTYPPQLQSSWDTTQAELLQIRDWLAERKIRFLLALIPARQAIEPRSFHHTIAHTAYEPSDFELDKPYRNLESFGRANGIEVINGYPALKRKGETGVSLYLRNDLHFNAAGHEAFAAEIAGYLQRSPR